MIQATKKHDVVSRLLYQGDSCEKETPVKKNIPGQRRLLWQGAPHQVVTKSSLIKWVVTNLLKQHAVVRRLLYQGDSCEKRRLL